MALDVEAPKQNTPQAQSAPPISKSKNVAIGVIVVLVILVVLVAAWFTLKSLNNDTSTTTATPATTQSNEVPVVKDDKDLEKLENELKNTAIDNVDSGIDANDTDAAGF